MKLTPMHRAYWAWCQTIDPGFKKDDYPFRGRLFEAWHAAWFAALEYAYKGESDEDK